MFKPRSTSFPLVMAGPWSRPSTLVSVLGKRKIAECLPGKDAQSGTAARRGWPEQSPAMTAE